ELMKVPVETATRCGPTWPSTTGDNQTHGRELDKHLHERFGRGRLHRELVVVDGKPRIVRPVGQVFGQHLAEDSRVFLGSIRRAQTLTHATAGAGNDLSRRLGESYCQRGNVRRSRTAPIPGRTL